MFLTQILLKIRDQSSIWHSILQPKFYDLGARYWLVSHNKNNMKRKSSKIYEIPNGKHLSDWPDPIFINCWKDEAVPILKNKGKWCPKYHKLMWYLLWKWRKWVPSCLVVFCFVLYVCVENGKLMSTFSHLFTQSYHLPTDPVEVKAEAKQRRQLN